MRNKNFSKTLGLFLILFLLQQSLKSQTLSQIKQYTLKNGFTVILLEDHTKALVTGITVIKAGSKNDPKEYAGLAHYQEHMLFKGTEDMGTKDWEKEKPHIDRIFTLYDELAKTKDEEARKKIQLQINDESVKANEYVVPNEFSDMVKSIGGTDLNANTSNDRTVFYNIFPPNQIEKWLTLYSDRLLNPVFRGFQSELEVVYEEKNSYADNFGTALIEKFNKYLYKNHPYGQQSVIGTVEQLKNPSLNKMYDFFKTYYVANNMALVLVGDFKTEDLIPLIEAKFGRLKTGTTTEFPKYPEADFKGRELVKVRLSPVKLGILGFRTVPNGHKDKIALDVFNQILNNSNGTGLLDKLSIDNKLLMAQCFNATMNDYGSEYIMIVPKILGQKLGKAEKLVLAEIDKIKKGDFPDWMIEAIKNELYQSYVLSLESVETKAFLLAETYSENRDVNEVLLYPQKLKAITKNDIIDVANRYFGSNYLAFMSKMGFPKKDKIAKPDFKPVVQKNKEKSDYAKVFENIKSIDLQPQYIDFQKDIETKDIQQGYTLYYTPNPVNDIFSLYIKFKRGLVKDPKLKYTSMLMDYVGTKDMKVSDFRSEFSKIGCRYSFYIGSNYTTINIQGIENNLNKALVLINKIITEPKAEDNKINNIAEGEKANRKVEKSEVDAVAGALDEYIMYGDKSDYIDRLTMGEIKKLKCDTLLNYFIKATKYSAEFHYTGTIGSDKVIDIIKQNISLQDKPVDAELPLIKPYKQYDAPAVYFVDKPNSIQSKIFLFANADTYDKSQEADINEFNMYFSGDFSGLLLQEIREYRSLAYGADASYSSPLKLGERSLLYGYLQTQADKTTEAMTVFDSLLHFMPQKPERLDLIRTYLKGSLITSKPDFRDLSQSIIGWKWKGYTEDPRKELYAKYSNMNFDDIYSFYKSHVQNKAYVFAIVADKKRMLNCDLTKYGKLIELPLKSLYRD